MHPDLKVLMGASLALVSLGCKPSIPLGNFATGQRPKVEEELNKLSDPRNSRESLVADFRSFARENPDLPSISWVTRLIPMLEKMAEEDKEHAAKSIRLEDLKGNERVAELIFELRDQTANPQLLTIGDEPDVTKNSSESPAGLLLIGAYRRSSAATRFSKRRASD